MALWDPLDRELDLWRAAGRRARFWWRDDDAQAPTNDLDQLLRISARRRIPVHLGVIPSGLSPDLAARLAREDTAWVLQHGFAHKNHEPRGTPASEVGISRDMALQQRDLAQGWEILTNAQMPRLLPGLIPPWNRISEATLRRLPEFGYSLVSVFDGRSSGDPVPGLVQIDCHIDPIRWKYGRQFRGAAKMVEHCVTQLSQRRQSGSDAPIGYVTHHLQTENAIWEFTDAWMEHLTASGVCDWHRLDSFLPNRSAP
ncbi:MAG: polysaccharide deacetylase family protein [Sulfitobacter sp.]